MSEKNNVIHPQALVQTDHVGPHASIGAFARVCPHAEVGMNTIVRDQAYLGNDVRLGAEVVIDHGVYLPGNVTIEDRAALGPLVAVVEPNVRANRAALNRDYPQTVIREGAQVGARATLQAGVTVGRYARVEAGSWVTADVPDFARVVGEPAAVVGWMCACGEPLIAEQGEPIRCTCGRAYALADGRLGELGGTA